VPEVILCPARFHQQPPSDHTNQKGRSFIIFLLSSSGVSGNWGKEPAKITPAGGKTKTQWKSPEHPGSGRLCIGRRLEIVHHEIDKAGTIGRRYLVQSPIDIRITFDPCEGRSQAPGHQSQIGRVNCGQGCSTLSFATPHRFIPAHHHSTFGRSRGTASPPTYRATPSFRAAIPRLFETVLVSSMMKKRPWRVMLFLTLFIGLSLLLPPAEKLHATAWSLLPPLLAIGLALWARQVVVSLFLGIWLGATMLVGNPFFGFLRVVDTNIRQSLVNSDHISILVFSVLLGGMVGVMSRAGGTAGIVQVLEKLATTPRRTQIVTWLMGVAIFFDDYSNTLIVGHSMRPVTDRQGVSREKLAFLVDSTAAPVACIAVVSTWVGYQVSVLGDSLLAGGSHLNPFSIFLESIPMAFYPLAALSLTFFSAAGGRDFGPMLAAERRAAQGEIIGPDAHPLADFDAAGLEAHPDAPRRWFNAALPVLTVVLLTLAGLYFTGLRELQEKGGSDFSLSRIIGASDPFTVLLWASLSGLALAILLAVSQGILDLEEALEATMAGFRSMLIAVVVLTLAWSLGQVCTSLGTADWLKQAVAAWMPPGLLPAAVFVVAALVSFSTGTSWGTIAILTPLAIPLLLEAAPHPGTLLPLCVSAILGGSVFGDHCSPISDTTVMSSMASGSDHVDHVRTQLPYALLAAGIACLVGYLPMGLWGLSEFIAFPLVILSTLLAFHLLSTKVRP